MTQVDVASVEKILQDWPKTARESAQVMTAVGEGKRDPYVDGFVFSPAQGGTGDSDHATMSQQGAS